MLDFYLFTVLIVICAGMLVPVQGYPNITVIANDIWRGHEPARAWREIACIVGIAFCWPIVLVVLIVVGIVLLAHIKDG